MTSEPFTLIDRLIVPPKYGVNPRSNTLSEMAGDYPDGFTEITQWRGPELININSDIYRVNGLLNTFRADVAYLPEKGAIKSRYKDTTNDPVDSLLFHGQLFALHGEDVVTPYARSAVLLAVPFDSNATLADAFPGEKDIGDYTDQIVEYMQQQAADLKSRGRIYVL